MAKKREQIRWASMKETLMHMERGTAKLAPIAGGTVSSGALKHCLDVAKMLDRNTFKLMPGVEVERKRVLELIRTWRVSLVRHNAQPKKFVEYDLETGEPKNSLLEALERISTAELLASMNDPENPIIFG